MEEIADSVKRSSEACVRKLIAEGHTKPEAEAIVAQAWQQLGARLSEGPTLGL